MQISPVSAVRKYLLSVGTLLCKYAHRSVSFVYRMINHRILLCVNAGWELAWIDGVTTEITKRTLKTSVEQCEAVIRYLTGLGLPTHVIENMVSISKPILGRSVDQLEAVVSWVKRQGLGDAAALELLRAHPMLLTYDPAPDSSYLQKGQARAALNFGKRNGLKVVGVVQWREGAAFKGPPVTPTPPASL